MPDLTSRSEWDVFARGARHRERTQSELPRDFEAKMPSKTQICACGLSSSAAC